MRSVQHGTPELRKNSHRDVCGRPVENAANVGREADARFGRDRASDALTLLNAENVPVRRCVVVVVAVGGGFVPGERPFR